MIKYLILGSLFLFSCTTTFCQNKKQLNGPGVKNHKPWQKDNQQKPVYHAAVISKKTGPKAKNQKPWQNKVQSGNHRMIVPKKRTVNTTKLRMRRVW